MDKIDCVIWHDLREEPNKLPQRKREDSEHSIWVLNQDGDRVLYSYSRKEWLCEFDTILESVDNEVIAWCYIPTFDVE